MDSNSRIKLFLQNNSSRLEHIRSKSSGKIFFYMNRSLNRLCREYDNASTPEEKLAACTAVLNSFEESLAWRMRMLCICLGQDVEVFIKQLGRRKTIDKSDKSAGDYYSVAVILKTEARYIREFVLFYQATGADRIYIYDNDSTDSLLEELRPFIDSGLVVYRSWPGRNVQTAAYRDVIRRTKGRTKWLAVIDSDEYLFSPRGSMPDQLKAYEQYPGVGANWVHFGPNGHDKRPKGLIMDNYTTALTNEGPVNNCHIKSIVQPKEVSFMVHTHYPYYRCGRYAVDEDGEKIDNRNSYSTGGGRAFTEVNHREIFRINHYNTRSLEDLREKCERGFADGSPNTIYKKALEPFESGVTEDKVIKPYADIVREQYNQKI